MIKNRLITTNIISLLSLNEQNILLGEWCFDDKQKTDFDKFKYKKINYHFNKIGKLQADFKYLNNLYPKILNSLTKFLNEYHETKYSKRYWEIIIGPTLVQLLSVFWDRWESIKSAAKNYDINNVPIIEYEPADFISQDFNDIFTNKLDSHFWNNCVFSEIIKESFKLNISKIKNEYFKNKSFFVNQDLESNHEFKILDKILSKFINSKDILIYKLNLGKANFFKYIIGQRRLSRSFSEFSKKIKIDGIKIDRNFKLDFAISNDFEKMLSKKMLLFFPLSHLEGYKKVQSEAIKIKLKPKYIVTAFGHVVNDLFKIWLAEVLEKNNSKLVISSHGGYVEKCINFNSWINISDKFISWEKNNDNKIVQLPPPYLKTNNKDHTTKNKNILFCTSNTNLYAYRIQDYIISSQIVECLKFWENLFRTMNAKIKDKIVIRHVPNFDRWNQKEKLVKLFQHNALSKKKKFIDELKTSKIVINTAMQTTFFESMSFGVPTLVLLKDDLWNLTKKGKIIYEKLKENKIIFNDIKKLNEHLMEIAEQPNLWWNSKKILKIREEFHDHYCKRKNFNQWNDFFNNLNFS